jgi:ribosome biogenesis SPOUT family RNA methylase Rps3
LVENGAKNQLKFVIEHLEPSLGKWLLIEYKHASEIVGANRIIFTNIKKRAHAAKLSRFGTVKSESFDVIFPLHELVILDPRADEPLKSQDLTDKKAFVIGGILGDHPPRGRTYQLITSRSPGAVARNLGKLQFPIDGAVYVAKLVSEGLPLEKVPIKRGLTIRVSREHSIYLPYAYPLRDGKPVISKELIEHLLSK